MITLYPNASRRSWSQVKAYVDSESASILNSQKIMFDIDNLIIIIPDKELKMDNRKHYILSDIRYGARSFTFPAKDNIHLEELKGKYKLVKIKGGDEPEFELQKISE